MLHIQRNVTWNIHGKVGNEILKWNIMNNNIAAYVLILQVIQQNVTWNIHGNKIFKWNIANTTTIPTYVTQYYKGFNEM